jgi:hypothetical protein
VVVYGGEGEKVSGWTKEVGDGGMFGVLGRVEVKVVLSRCVTRGHAMY